MTTLFLILLGISVFSLLLMFVTVSEVKERTSFIFLGVFIVLFLFLIISYNITKKYEYIKPTTISIEEYGDKIILKIDDTALIETNIKWKNKDRIYLKKSSNMWDITNEEYIIKDK